MHRVADFLSRAALVVAVGTALSCAGEGNRVRVEDAWVRAVEVVPGQMANTAAYMRIEGNARVADQLLDVRAEFAMAELHRTTIDASGLATMAPARPVTVQRGESVRLEPGGLHVMLMGVTRSLSAGQAVQITLVFETAGEVTVRAEVREF